MPEIPMNVFNDLIAKGATEQQARAAVSLLTNLTVNLSPNGSKQSVIIGSSSEPGNLHIEINELGLFNSISWEQSTFEQLRT